MAESFPKLILASNSPARADVLSQLNLKFEIIPSNVDENYTTADPERYVVNLSEKKAKTVCSLIESKFDDFIVLGFDTVILDRYKQVIGKPVDRNHAKSLLVTLSNDLHQVLTGCTLIIYPSQEVYQKVVSTDVYFRDLSPEEIEFYLSQNEWKGKAGGYAIQGLGSLLIKAIKGDYYNVVGLPVNWVWETLLTHYGNRFLKKVKNEC